VYVSDGTFSMSGNANISGNISRGGGGGVAVVNANSVFTMTGGTISNNTSKNDDKGGGGVYVLNGGAFTMNGGTISGNYSGGFMSEATGRGGGVAVENSTFTMKSGEISGNTVSGSGGGVYVINAASTFTMNGGSISGNKAASYGGGVYVGGGATFNKVPGNGGALTSGTIYGYPADGTPDNSNRVGTRDTTGNIPNPIAGRGHAVYVSDGRRREVTADLSVSIHTGDSEGLINQ
jgi:hypothetical protein